MAATQPVDRRTATERAGLARPTGAMAEAEIRWTEETLRPFLSKTRNAATNLRP